jgi:hypothetical protein
MAVNDAYSGLHVAARALWGAFTAAAAVCGCGQGDRDSENCSQRCCDDLVFHEYTLG